MTTTTAPLSPERVKAALEFVREELDVLARERASSSYNDALNDISRATNDQLTTEYGTLAALARAHLDATKREPPAGLVEVIAQQIVATFPGSPQLPSAIARAVETFATSPESVSRVSQVIWEIESSYLRAAIRAALGVKEESE